MTGQSRQGSSYHSHHRWMVHFLVVFLSNDSVLDPWRRRNQSSVSGRFLLWSTTCWLFNGNAVQTSSTQATDHHGRMAGPWTDKIFDRDDNESRSSLESWCPRSDKRWPTNERKVQHMWLSATIGGKCNNCSLANNQIESRSRVIALDNPLSSLHLAILLIQSKFHYHEWHNKSFNQTTSQEEGWIRGGKAKRRILLW